MLLCRFFFAAALALLASAASAQTMEFGCPKPGTTFEIFKVSSWFNGRHMLFAWLSLFWVAFTDFYIQLVSRGVITDLNTWS